MQYDLEYVLNSALDGIFIVANDHRLVLFNRACEQLYGISREDLLEKACWKLAELESERSHKNSETRGQIAYGELASKKERMILPHKNGKEVWVETIYSPIYDPETNEIAYVMGVIKDITEQKKLEDEKEKLLFQLGTLRKELERKYDFSNIVGRSPEFLDALHLTGEVAKQNTTVLILGESGTGKELLAKAIHYNSPRASRPMVAINCSAFPDTLIESELFGYEKGAFTGADKSKPGKVQLANGGTLFMDEVSEMSIPAQAKVLRLIQEREFQPLGGVHTLKTDIRIIAATNKDLERLVKEGKFREDLYYRLYVYPITVPPLRERREDLPLLVDWFLKRMNREMGRQIKKLEPQAMDVLANYPWPGNVRELQNVIERLMILCKQDVVRVADLPRYLREKREEDIGISGLHPPDSLPNRFSLEQYVKGCENRIIVSALRKSGFNKSKAAGTLGLTRSTFRYKLSKVPKEMLKADTAVSK
ncbi:MAG: sigma-54-dependent Fis family transcriptional regulator [Nitrospinaceae bacterium]|nr:MAG: sigma-54-dependent Fis family transcriptional regulator [Nitrospinaceae bacterium]